MRDTERARSALAFLNYADRDVWVKAAMALKSEFGEDGFEIWDSWGSQHDKHSPGAAKSTWKSIKPGGKVNFGSLIFDAKAAGWKDDSNYKKPSKAEIDARNAAAAARAKLAAEQEAAEHAEAALRAQAIWDAATPATDHPYLARKGVAAHGLRVGPWQLTRKDTGEIVTICPNALLVPIYDRTRKLQSLQAIFPEQSKILKRDKDYLKNGNKHGNFLPIGKPVYVDDCPVFILAEGYATGASVHACTGHMVLVCFDTSNLPAVALALRARMADAIIIVAADNDTETEGNPGLKAANKAKDAAGCLIAVPPPGDFNDLHLAQGPEAVAAIIADVLCLPDAADAPDETPPWEGPEAPAPATAPVEAVEDEEESPLEVDDEELTQQAAGHFTILGYDGDNYFIFHAAKKQILRRTAGGLTKTAMVELAPINWWEEQFPNQKKGGWNELLAVEWIMNVANARGVFDPAKVRGRGAWHDKGRIVFHHGDHLTVDGERHEIGGVPSAYVYPMAPRMPPLTTNQATDEDGKYLLRVAEMARWAMPGSAALLAGWVYLSRFCGALPWRPHIWITGAAGSGKTSIQQLYVDPLIHGMSAPFMGNSSEAGIRQSIEKDAIAVTIDELEPNDEADRKRIESIITLVRQASSESTAQTVKGSAGGDGISYHIRSMFCVSSINTMLDKDSDVTRITKLTLKPAAKSGSVDDQWEAMSTELDKIKAAEDVWPSRLLARVLSMPREILENVKVFRKAASARFGTHRKGDQYGTLLAGTWCLISRKVATMDEAFALIDKYDWSEQREEATTEDSAKALACILQAKIRVSNVDVSVYELIAEAAGSPVGHTAFGMTLCVDVLVRNGIKIIGSDIVMGTGVVALRQFAVNTPYYSDLHGQLLRLPGARRYGAEPGSKKDKTVRFMGSVSRAVCVPLDTVLEDVGPI